MARLTANTVVDSGGFVISVPVGTIFHWAPYNANAAPAGYLKCNGAAVSRTTYSNLFAVIGTTYGTGDGSTTFNLPDTRGYFLRAWDDSRGVDSGRTIGSAQSDALGSHSHYVTTYQGNKWTGQSNRLSDANGWAYWTSGSSGGAETRPACVSMHTIIKY